MKNTNDFSQQYSSRSKMTVCARLRPIISEDYRQANVVKGAPDVCVHFKKDGQTIKILQDSLSQKLFRMDYTFDISATQTEVYNTVIRPIIKDVLKGNNGTIIAYGPTAAGKSYTIFGSETKQGITNFAINEVYDRIREYEESERVAKVYVTFYQIYLEQIYDLLNVEEQAQPLSLHEQDGNVIVDNLRHIYAKDQDTALEIIRQGLQNRRVYSSNFNMRSSRSHAILQFHIDMEEDHLANTNEPYDGSNEAYRHAEEEKRSSSQGNSLHSQGNQNIVEETYHVGRRTLTFVDLAGSERLSSHKPVSKQVMMEATAINKSIAELGNCIAALAHAATHPPTNTLSSSDKYQPSSSSLAATSSSFAPPALATTTSSAPSPHIPYRNSKLTRILAPWLGGFHHNNNRTVLIVNVNPCSYALEETLSTMKFAVRAKQIRHNPNTGTMRMSQPTNNASSTLPLSVRAERLSYFQERDQEKDRLAKDSMGIANSENSHMSRSVGAIAMGNEDEDALSGPVATTISSHPTSTHQHLSPLTFQSTTHTPTSSVPVASSPAALPMNNNNNAFNLREFLRACTIANRLTQTQQFLQQQEELRNQQILQQQQLYAQQQQMMQTHLNNNSNNGNNNIHVQNQTDKDGAMSLQELSQLNISDLNLHNQHDNNKNNNPHNTGRASPRSLSTADVSTPPPPPPPHHANTQYSTFMNFPSPAFSIKSLDSEALRLIHHEHRHFNHPSTNSSNDSVSNNSHNTQHNHHSTQHHQQAFSRSLSRSRDDHSKETSLTTDDHMNTNGNFRAQKQLYTKHRPAHLQLMDEAEEVNVDDEDDDQDDSDDEDEDDMLAILEETDRILHVTSSRVSRSQSQLLEQRGMVAIKPALSLTIDEAESISRFPSQLHNPNDNNNTTNNNNYNSQYLMSLRGTLAADSTAAYMPQDTADVSPAPGVLVGLDKQLNLLTPSASGSFFFAETPRVFKSGNNNNATTNGSFRMSNNNNNANGSFRINSINNTINSNNNNNNNNKSGLQPQQLSPVRTASMRSLDSFRLMQNANANANVGSNHVVGPSTPSAATAAAARLRLQRQQQLQKEQELLAAEQQQTNSNNGNSQSSAATSAGEKYALLRQNSRDNLPTTATANASDTKRNSDNNITDNTNDTKTTTTSTSTQTQTDDTQTSENPQNLASQQQQTPQQRRSPGMTHFTNALTNKSVSSVLSLPADTDTNSNNNHNNSASNLIQMFNKNSSNNTSVNVTPTGATFHSIRKVIKRVETMSQTDAPPSLHDKSVQTLTGLQGKLTPKRKHFQGQLDDFDEFAPVTQVDQINQTEAIFLVSEYYGDSIDQKELTNLALLDPLEVACCFLELKKVVETQAEQIARLQDLILNGDRS